MTKERELLRRAYELLDRRGQVENFDKRQQLLFDIHTYFSTPSDDAEEPEAKPVLYIKEQELLYIQVLKQEGLAQEWKSNLGFVKEAGDVGLYLHPPKPAEPEAEPKTWQGLKMHEVASLWSEALDPAYFARAIEQALKEKNTRPELARKPMTSEEMMKQYEIDKEYFGESVMRAFYNGIRFAEKHHGIGGDDDKQG